MKTLLLKLPKGNLTSTPVYIKTVLCSDLTSNVALKSGGCLSVYCKHPFANVCTTHNLIGFAKFHQFVFFIRLLLRNYRNKQLT